MRTKKTRAILARLAKRMKGHNHCANILDDAFTEEVQSKATEFISERDYRALIEVMESGEDEDALAEATDIVIDSFLRYLGYTKARKLRK